MVLLQCGIAWIVSYVVNAFGLLVTGGIAQLSLTGLAAAVVIAAAIGVYLKLQNKEIDLAPARTACKDCNHTSCGCH